MKEFSLNLTEYLLKGVKKHPDNRINTPGLESLYGLIPKSYGLVPFVPPSNALTASPELLLHESFDSSYNWTLGGTSAPTITGGNLVFNGTGYAQQSIATGLDVNNIQYTIGIKISGMTKGELHITFGDITSSAYTANGTYYFYDTKTSGTLFKIDAPVDTTATVEFVTVKYKTGFNFDSSSFPQPILFKGNYTSLLVYRDALFSVSSPSSITRLSVYDFEDVETEVGFSVYHGNISFAETAGGWYLFSSAGCAVLIKGDQMGYSSDIVLYTRNTFVNAGCYNKGRLIIGGFDNNNFWTDDWKFIWEQWEEMSLWNFSPSQSSFDQNTIIWSNIGYGILWLFSANYALYGTIYGKQDIDRPFILELIKRNDMGWMNLPTDGTVYRIKPLLNHTIVYTSKGIFSLTPVDTPIVTMKLKTLAEFGIDPLTDIAVSDNMHIFISNNGKLWQLTSDLIIRELDYSSFLSSLNNVVHICSYNKNENEFIFTTERESYILSVQAMSDQIFHGLTQVNSRIYYASINSSGTLVAIHEDTGDDTAQFVTDVFDMNITGIKTITSIDIGCNVSSGQTVSIRVHYKYKKSDSFSTTSWKTVNDEGWVYFPISGVEFKIEFKSTLYTGTNVTSLIAHYTVNDKRNVRGI